VSSAEAADRVAADSPSRIARTANSLITGDMGGSCAGDMETCDPVSGVEGQTTGLVCLADASITNRTPRLPGRPAAKLAQRS